MKIYNLFPRLAGEFKDWDRHIERASSMGFDWIFVNPIQQPGISGSLYSIADYFQINPQFVDKKSRKKPDRQVLETIRRNEKQWGVKFMIDLVINHCAIDSAIVKKHPKWFLRDSDGKVAHPDCMEDGQQVVWYDLARFDHERIKHDETLYQFYFDIVEHFISLGFKGFRCDAAYQIPSFLWRRLIGGITKKYPDVIFTAETLGCTAEQSKQTAEAGFSFIFNSSKWWDFSSPWLLEQYQSTREIVPSISFPESHDTNRLYQDSYQNAEVLKQRYFFAAIFSAGVMIPMGFEFGFQKPLHVVNSRPEDWESIAIDLTDFIREVNLFKSKYQVFQEEGPIHIIDHEHDAMLFFRKTTHCSREQALVILNKDPSSKQYFAVDNLYHYVHNGEPLVDISTEYTLDFIPTPYEFELHPGMGRVMVATNTL
ncbi:MAG: alpha-amylase family glycosyl hydrolase [Methylococcaceae bacterium]